MALKKTVTMSNGIPLEYHRIALVTIEPNQQITILRHSYLNEEARQYEKDYADGKIKDPTFPYVDSNYIHIDYKDCVEKLNGDIMTCAYELLKEQCEDLKDAEDI